jgi:serine/threonine-protein kinase
VTLRGLERDPIRRFSRARDMALALENCVAPARSSAVGEWVTMLGEQQLHDRARVVADIEGQKSRAITSVISQTFERPDGFNPTVVETRPGGPKSQRRTRKIVVAGAVLLAVLTLSFMVAKRSGWRATAASAEAVAPTVGRSDRAALAPTAPSRAPAEPESVAVPTAQPIEQAAAPPSSAPAAAKGIPRRTAAPPKPRHKTAAAACDPPFTIDSDGHKHYKLNCL